MSRCRRNQNIIARMIALGLLFLRAPCDASNRESSWKPRFWCCGISSIFCTAREVDRICDGSIVLNSSGSIVEAALLRRLQVRRCGQTGGRLWKDAEVDHRIPLFRVWRDHRDERWPKLLSYWGLPNLQVISRRPRSRMRDRSAVQSLSRYFMRVRLTKN
jgi:hypothetical protein